MGVSIDVRSSILPPTIISFDDDDVDDGGDDVDDGGDGDDPFDDIICCCCCWITAIAVDRSNLKFDAVVDVGDDDNFWAASANNSVDNVGDSWWLWW